jgi:hypothetical protein
MTYSESYDMVVLTIPNSALYFYPEPRNYSLKLQKNYQRGFCWFLGSSQLIDFTPLNGDCSAQGRGRKPNVVWLEPHGHKVSEYCMSSKVSSMPVNVTATQNKQPLHFLQQGGGALWVTYVRMATLQEFYETDRFLTTFCDQYLGDAFRLFTHAT